MTGSDEVEGRAGPAALEEPLEAGLDAVLDALDDVLSAFRSARCVLKATKVLRLDAEADALNHLASELGKVRDSLAGAGDAIAMGGPIARSFRHGELPWYERGWGPRLTPRQYWALAMRGADVLPSELVIYSEVMRKEYPLWATDQERRADEWAQGAATRVRELKRRQRVDALLLEDVESRECPKCDASGGQACITRQGNPGGPHIVRKNLSPFRKNFARELSDLRRSEVVAWLRPSRGSETDRERLARFIARVANSLAPPDCDDAERASRAVSSN